MLLCGAGLKQKHHIIVHLAVRQQFSGAARLASTWLDESLNRKAKAIAVVCHGLTWYRAFLTRVDRVLGDVEHAELL